MRGNLSVVLVALIESCDFGNYLSNECELRPIGCNSIYGEKRESMAAIPY